MGLFGSNLSTEEKYGKACLLTFGENQKLFEKGYKSFVELDQAGFVEASLVLAMMSRNPSDKYTYITKAAKAGNCEAIWQSTMFMPHSYIPNRAVAQDALWEDTCLKAAERFNVDAMNEMGNIYNRRKNYAEAMYWYSMANAYGHQEGKISQTGLASNWLAAGAPRTFQHGSPRFDRARFDCAICYLEWNTGMKITKPIQEIVAYALAGIPIAVFLAGDIFEAQNNDAMAYKMYNALAFTNDPHGLRCYADMLMMGKGTNTDPGTAQKYYQLAALGGDREAMYITGEFLKGTNVNLAAYWYGLSHVRGYRMATERLQQLANQVGDKNTRSFSFGWGKNNSKPTTNQGASQQAKAVQTINDRKNADRPVWRDNTGKLFCPGDNCKQDCDDRCPIFLNTRGLQFLSMGKPWPAIANFKQAIELAPDFADAYNNMGAAQGSMNQHQEAYESYKKALSLKMPYPNALYGMIVAEKNLGKYQDALSHCDMYDKLPGCNSKDLRAEINKLSRPQPVPEKTYGRTPAWTPDRTSENKKSHYVIANELIKAGRKEGYITSESLHVIPELSDQADTVCEKLYKELLEYSKKMPNTDAVAVTLTLAWSAYAGMGSVWFWNKDKYKLLSDGIVETLTKARGLYEMDEYVLDEIGISLNSPKGKELEKFLPVLSSYCMAQTAGEKTVFTAEEILRAAKSMYIFGMIFEKDRLGI